MVRLQDVQCTLTNKVHHSSHQLCFGCLGPMMAVLVGLGSLLRRDDHSVKFISQKKVQIYIRTLEI